MRKMKGRGKGRGKISPLAAANGVNPGRKADRIKSGGRKMKGRY